MIKTPSMSVIWTTRNFNAHLFQLRMPR